MNKLTWLVASLALAASGCVVHVPRTGARMGRAEAVDRGFHECRARGYTCELKEAHTTGNGLWKVKFKVVAPGKGKLHLDYDAYSRRLVRADVNVKAPHRATAKHDEDDDKKKKKEHRASGHGDD